MFVINLLASVFTLTKARVSDELGFVVLSQHVMQDRCKPKTLVGLDVQIIRRVLLSIR